MFVVTEPSYPLDRRTFERVGRGCGDVRICSAGSASKPVANPDHSHNAEFVALGRAYLPQLGKAYAAAWEEGAKQLEAGGGIAASLDAVSQTWLSNRTQLYDRVLTPEFAKILPESVEDAEVTPQERSAMAAAWRGLSLGLGR